MGIEQNEILVIGDDAVLRSAIGILLQGEGYSVALARNRCEGYTMDAGRGFDLILIDSMPPDSKGWIACSDIRQAGILTPIMVLTARIEATDQQLGFRLGADEFVTKPFDSAELLARIKALIGRSRVRPLEPNDRVGAIKVDVRRARVTRNDKTVSMTAHEFRLLQYLLKRPGRCVSRGELLKAVWGYASNSATRTIDMHIASLRKKLEADPKFPQLIRTIPKVGYMYVDLRDTYHRRIETQLPVPRPHPGELPRSS